MLILLVPILFSIKPKLSKVKPNTKLNCVLFAKDSPAILVGDSTGCIEVIKPQGLDVNYASK